MGGNRRVLRKVLKKLTPVGYEFAFVIFNIIRFLFCRIVLLLYVFVVYIFINRNYEIIVGECLNNKKFRIVSIFCAEIHAMLTMQNYVDKYLTTFNKLFYHLAFWFINLRESTTKKLLLLNIPFRILGNNLKILRH